MDVSGKAKSVPAGLQAGFAQHRPIIFSHLQTLFQQMIAPVVAQFDLF